MGEGILAPIADYFNWDAGIKVTDGNPITIHRILHEAGIDDSSMPLPWNYVVGPALWGPDVIVWVKRGLYEVAMEVLDASGMEVE